MGFYYNPAVLRCAACFAQQLAGQRAEHPKPRLAFAQNITTISTWLRVLNFAGYSMSVLRQMPPLPAVPQPPSGHSLAFYIVAGKSG